MKKTIVFAETENFRLYKKKNNQLNFHFTNFENTHRKI